MSTGTSEPGDDFEAAKAVFEKLKDLSRERQERVLRWVAEGLGVANVATAPAPERPPVPSAPHPLTPPAHLALPGGGADIKSFIAAKNPRSDQQFATAVAYYYRFEAPPAQRKDTINAAALQEASRLAGRKRLTNPKNTLNNAKNQGYLDSASTGEFSVNTVGENLIAMALPGGESGAAPTARSTKARKAKKAKKVAKKRSGK